MTKSRKKKKTGPGGGHLVLLLFLVFLLIAGELFYLVTRRRLDPKYEGYLNAGFLVLILGFMAVVTFSDVWKLIK